MFAASAAGRLPAAGRSLSSHQPRRFAATRHRHTSFAFALPKQSPVVSGAAAARQPGPVKRPGLPSWAEYRLGSSGAADAPLAVLCGWLGCRQEYLRKYSSVYNAMGVDTIAVSPPVPYTILPTLADRATDDLLR